MKYQALNTALFEDNRKRFTDKMEANSLAIFHSNDEMPRNGDCFYVFRQHSDIFWLSGIDQEQSILLLYPDHPL